jgi:hypothetical protein
MISKYKWRFITGIILLAAVIYYISCSVAAVNHAVNDFNKSYFESHPQKESDTIDICAIPGYIDKLRKRSYLNSQDKLAASDSVGVCINMRDSTISLKIKGVEVRKIKIRVSIISPFFKRANQEALYSFLSTPLVVTNMDATLRKDPLKIKVAPKDTLEYQATMLEKPDTNDFEAVFYKLETDKNIQLFVAQAEDTLKTDRRAHFYFDFNDRLDHAKSDLKAITSFRTPDYTPFIKIWVPKADAKIIFYAIPTRGLIALTL